MPHGDSVARGRGEAARRCSLNVIDDHARFLLASRAFTITRAADVVRTFAETGAAHGYPSELLTDNGAIFTGAPRGGRSVLEVQLDALRIRAVRSRTYHPQTCGKVERFHQTLKGGWPGSARLRL